MNNFFRSLCLFLFLPVVSHAKVYDCFLFFNEIEILEIRLEELYDSVDYFVIVEANEGFRGHPKYYNFELHREGFKKFEDKIIYVKIDEHLEADSAWTREFWQRDQIMKGLYQCDDEDLILISDVDEFIPADLVHKAYEWSSSIDMIGFYHKMYRWFLNRDAQTICGGVVALRYKHLKYSTPQEARLAMQERTMPMQFGGWHFSSMGGYERIKEKYKNFSHGMDDEITYETWRRWVETHPLVEIDETYPKFVQENIEYLMSKSLIDID